jgi:hypothetical protein
MKKLIYFICLFASLLFINGCLTYNQGTWVFDYGTGEVVHVYHDIGSSKGSDIEKDWEDLKQCLRDPQPLLDYEPELLEVVKTELFEENGSLSGRILLKIKSPERFLSKAVVLAKLFEGKFRAEIINGEVFLFIPIHEQIISSNAQILKTKSNYILIWPEDTVRFEIRFVGEKGRGKSLLPYYLKKKT